MSKHGHVPTHSAGDVWIQRVHRRRKSGALIKHKRLLASELRALEERTFRGSAVWGTPASDYPWTIVFGVVQRTSRGNQKLLSKHETLDEAMRAADWRDRRIP